MEGAEAAVVDVNQAEFRVKVSLERYFSDERARCYMSCSRGRPVRALARRLRRAFALPRPFALLSRGHLLPPGEPLAVLQPDDPVEVIPTKFPVAETDSVVSRGTPSPEMSPPRSVSPGAATLDDMKRRALELLDGCAATAEPRARRRRVRRRRAPRPEPAPERAEPEPPPAAERAPRLVRALPDAEPASVATAIPPSAGVPLLIENIS